MAEATKPAKRTRRTSRTPGSVVDDLMSSDFFVTDKSGNMYRHNGRFYEDVPPTEITRRILLADPDCNANRRREIQARLEADSYVRDVPWGRVADYEVACLNGVVNLKTGQLRPHDPKDYLDRVLPWNYSPGAKAEAWEKALKVWFPEGEQGGEVAALQEFFGYMVLSHAKFKKALVLKGPSNSGKSVAVYAAQHLVGTANCCSLPVDAMDDPVTRSVLIGKSLNILSELSSDAMIADGGFKQLVSTEEPLLVNPKFKPPFMYLPTAKHMFATNAFPRIDDKSEATLGRLLVIPMLRVLAPEEMDEELKPNLLKNMEGLTLWAIAGARRLVERRGQFTPVPAGTAMLDEMRSEANPARDFVRECLEVDTSGDRTTALPLQLLVQTYNRWNAGSRKTTVKGLGKLLRAAGYVTREVHHGKRCLSSLIGYRPIREKMEREIAIDNVACFDGSNRPVRSLTEPEPGAPTAPEDDEYGEP